MGENLEEFIQKQKEVLTHSYEQAKQYSNIIILGGYAGIFAIRNFTKDDLEKPQVLWVGLCTLISLSIYIVFEIYGTWLRSTQIKNKMNELNAAEQFKQFPTEYGKSEIKRAQKYMAIWPFFFFSSIAFALIAAVILIFSFITGLING